MGRACWRWSGAGVSAVRARSHRSSQRPDRTDPMVMAATVWSYPSLSWRPGRRTQAGGLWRSVSNACPISRFAAPPWRCASDRTRGRIVLCAITAFGSPARPRLRSPSSSCRRILAQPCDASRSTMRRRDHRGGCCARRLLTGPARRCPRALRSRRRRAAVAVLLLFGSAARRTVAMVIRHLADLARPCARVAAVDRVFKFNPLTVIGSRRSRRRAVRGVGARRSADASATSLLTARCFCCRGGHDGRGDPRLSSRFGRMPAGPAAALWLSRR